MNYSAETAPHIMKEDVGYLAPWATRPYGDAPCDAYGNPINEDGTVQAYIIPSYSSDHYSVRQYKNLFDSLYKDHKDD